MSGSDTAPRDVSALLSEVADEDVCDLRTVGRVSGEPHVVELWFAADGDRIAFLAGGRERAAWVRNLQATPGAQVVIAGRAFAGNATFPEGSKREPVVRGLLAAKYQGWSEGRKLSSWAAGSLPVEIVVGREIAH